MIDMIGESVIEEIQKILNLYKCKYIKLFLVRENNRAKLTMYLISEYSTFKLEREYILKSLDENLESESEKIKNFLIELITPRIISEYKLNGHILRNYKIEPEMLKSGIIYTYTLYPSGKKVYNTLFISLKNNFLEIGVRLSGFIFS